MKEIKILLLIAVIGGGLFLFTACNTDSSSDSTATSTQPEVITTTPTNPATTETPTTPAPTEPPTTALDYPIAPLADEDKELAPMAMIKSVLNGNHTLFDADNDKQTDIYEYIARNSKYLTEELKIKFAVVDFDHDGIAEIVLDTNMHYTGERVVCHYEDNNVYLSLLAFRPSAYIYNNGITTGSGSAFTFYHYSISFDRGRVECNIETTWDDSHDSEIPDLYVGDKKVTEEEYNSFIDTLMTNSTEVEWYDYTDENINKYIVD